MADIAIRASAVANAPRDYTIPGAQEILPKAVTATYDATGAAAQYFPCFQVLDPGGNVMFSAVGQTALSPGGTADVSWFPGLGAGAGAAGASGAWTQVFHFDVPALGAPTTIDTGAGLFNSSLNQIFGIFNGASTKGTSPDELLFTVNADALGHYTVAYEYGDGNATVSPGTFHNPAGGLIGHGGLGFIGCTSDSVTTTGIFFVIPKVFQTTQSGVVVSYGGFTGIASGIAGESVTGYEFSTITQLTFTLSSGSAFAQGSSLTLWTV